VESDARGDEAVAEPSRSLVCRADDDNQSQNGGREGRDPTQECTGNVVTRGGYKHIVLMSVLSRLGFGLASIRISNGSPVYYDHYTKLHIVARIWLCCFESLKLINVSDTPSHDTSMSNYGNSR